MNDSIQYYFFNGKFVKNDEAVLTPYELGLLRGYGIFDFLRIVDGVPVFLEDHLDRFFFSADQMDLEIPYSRKEIVKYVHALIGLNNVGYSGIRLVLTGGFSESGFHSTQSNFYLLHHLLKNNPESYFTKGIKLITKEYIRDFPKIKTLNYAFVLRYQKQIKAEGAFDLLFVKDEIISESSRSNFFIIKDREIITSDDNALSGITRKKVLEICKDYKCTIRNIHVSELKTADEAFICGSTKPLVPVVQIDDLIIGDGQPGDLTKELRDKFIAYQSSYLNIFMKA